MHTVKFMKRLETLDTFKEVKKDNIILHQYNIVTTVVNENVSDDKIEHEFLKLLNESKLLGKNVEVNILKEYKNYADLTITFDDGKILNRIIYTIE